MEPMIRPASFLFGPELYWVVLYAAVRWMSARNVPSTQQGNESLERLWWLISLIAVPLTFALLRTHTSPQGWMLLRIDIATLIGLFACIQRTLKPSITTIPGTPV